MRPDADHPERQVDLFDVARDLEEQGVALPVLLRFSDILRARLNAISTRFTEAINEFGYTGGYTTVYPIKVNQQRHVVDEIVRAGRSHGVGLECGSKPELQAGITYTAIRSIIFKSSSFTLRTTLPGTPITTEPSGITLSGGTSAPAAMTQLLPTRARSSTMAPLNRPISTSDSFPGRVTPVRQVMPAGAVAARQAWIMEGAPLHSIRMSGAR